MSGRHRQRLHRRTVAAAASALAVLVIAGGLRFGLPLFADAGCTGRLKLSVAAAPEIAPTIETLARQWSTGTTARSGPCLDLAVTAAESSDVAAAISREQKASLNGLDTATGTVAVPDVWISDSSTWLVRLRAAVPGFTVTDEGPVALSPVVLAMPAGTAEKLGWPDRRIGYQQIVGELTTSTTLRAGVVEPARDAIGLSGLLAMNTNSGGSLSGVLHALAAGRSALPSNLLQEFPQAADENTVATALGLAPLSEQDVITYNAASPTVPLAAIYPSPAPLSLDYPFTVLPGAGSAQVDAAHQLYAALHTAASVDVLGRAGFRAGDGSSPGPFSPPSGAPGKVTPPAAGKQTVTASVINRALAGWSGVVAPARALAVIDASKSMAAPVVEGGDDSRMAVTLDAARGGLTLFSDDWQVGVWEFDGAGHRQIVGIRPLSSDRRSVAHSFDGIGPNTADAGLYRTILDAYQAVQQGWQAGRVNSVLVLTDGVPGPKQGDLALSDLLAKLSAARDPGRPVQIVIVGVGDSVVRAPLDEITRTVGGGVFIATDAAQVVDVFSQAISLRVAVAR